MDLPGLAAATALPAAVGAAEVGGARAGPGVQWAAPGGAAEPGSGGGGGAGAAAGAPACDTAALRSPLRLHTLAAPSLNLFAAFGPDGLGRLEAELAAYPPVIYCSKGG